MKSTTTSRMEVKLKGNELLKEDMSADYWKNGSRRLWIASMFLGTMFLYAARSAVPLCIAAMSKEMSWDKEADGAVMSAFFWGYTPAQIIGGYLSDRYGGELVLGVLTGLSQGLHYPSLTNIIVKRIPLNERSLMTGSVFAAGPVGTLLMGSAGSVILIFFGWQSVFLLQGVVAMFWAWIWRYYATQLYSTTNKTEISIENIKIVQPRQSQKHSPVIVPYGLFIRHTGVWALIVAQFCQSGAFWNIFSWLPLYFEEVFPTSKKWVFNVMPWIVLFPCSSFAGLLADHMIRSGWSVTFVRKLFQTISMWGASLCMLLFSWVSNFNQALFLIMITLALNSIGNSGIVVAPQDMAPKFAGSLFGKCMGLYLSVWVLI
ncbi:hypothetical protein QZH41_011850, partial [Actinostola sp. cb2023]